MRLYLPNEGKSTTERDFLTKIISLYITFGIVFVWFSIFSLRDQRVLIQYIYSIAVKISYFLYKCILLLIQWECIDSIIKKINNAESTM